MVHGATSMMSKYFPLVRGPVESFSIDVVLSVVECSMISVQCYHDFVVIALCMVMLSDSLVMMIIILLLITAEEELTHEDTHRAAYLLFYKRRTKE